MGVPSVSGTFAFSGQDSLALTREVGAVGSSRAAACPSCKPPRDEPPEGHRVSRAGCSKVWSPFPASSWHYWDDFGLVSSLLSVFGLLREQLSLPATRSSGMSTGGTG